MDNTKYVFRKRGSPLRSKRLDSLLEPVRHVGLVLVGLVHLNGAGRGTADRHLAAFRRFERVVKWVDGGRAEPIAR
jgi:hypothetical protein